MNKSTTAMMIKETSRNSYEHLIDYSQCLAEKVSIDKNGSTVYLFEDRSSLVVDDQQRCAVH
jgi:hypothetical protein